MKFERKERKEDNWKQSHRNLLTLTKLVTVSLVLATCQVRFAKQLVFLL